MNEYHILNHKINRYIINKIQHSYLTYYFYLKFPISC